MLFIRKNFKSEILEGRNQFVNLSVDETIIKTGLNKDIVWEDGIPDSTQELVDLPCSRTKHYAQMLPADEYTANIYE